MKTPDTFPVSLWENKETKGCPTLFGDDTGTDLTNTNTSSPSSLLTHLPSYSFLFSAIFAAAFFFIMCILLSADINELDGTDDLFDEDAEPDDPEERDCLLLPLLLLLLLDTARKESLPISSYNYPMLYTT